MGSKFSRRRFIGGGTALAGASMFAPLPGRAATATNELTSSRFVAQIGTRFLAHALGATTQAPLVLWLHAVAPLRHPVPSLQPDRMKERSFELTFAVDGVQAVQDSYQLDHQTLDTFWALLVPSRDRKRLIAVFNRLG